MEGNDQLEKVPFHGTAVDSDLQSIWRRFRFRIKSKMRRTWFKYMLMKLILDGHCNKKCVFVWWRKSSGDFWSNVPKNRSPCEPKIEVLTVKFFDDSQQLLLICYWNWIILKLMIWGDSGSSLYSLYKFPNKIINLNVWYEGPVLFLYALTVYV